MLGVNSLLIEFRAGLAAIARIYPIKQIYDGSSDPNDFERDWMPLALCSAVEVGIGIIAASMASMRPVLQSIRLRTRIVSYCSFSRLLSRSKGQSREETEKRKKANNAGSVPDDMEQQDEGEDELTGIQRTITVRIDSFQNLSLPTPPTDESWSINK
jgi:hypothetical protein